MALAGNAIAFVFFCSIGAIPELVSRWRNGTHPRTVLIWTIGGAVGIAALATLALVARIVVPVTEPFVVLAYAALAGAIGGSIVGGIIARTVAARATAERRKRRWHSLFTETPTAIADLSIDESRLRIVTVNEAFRDDFPVDGTYQGQSFTSVVAMEDTEVDLETAVREGRPITTKFSQSRADGQRYYRLRLTPYRFGNGQRRAFAIITDGTSLKAMERELQRTVETLSRKNDQLEQFASVVSHDLRNPLNVAQGHVQLVRDGVEDEDSHLRKASEALDRIEALVSDQLTLAQHGRTIDDPDPVAIEAIARDCWAAVETAEMDLVVREDATVVADDGRLRQLFENLFRNAREHAGDDVSVVVGTLADGAGFFVADDGPGIPEDESEAVFEPGYTSADANTGLGLNIVREIAQAHGWTVDVGESADGGARFEFRGVDRD